MSRAVLCASAAALIGVSIKTSALQPAPGANRLARQMDSCDLMRLTITAFFRLILIDANPEWFARGHPSATILFKDGAQYSGTCAKSPKTAGETFRKIPKSADEGTRSQHLHFRGI